MVDFSLDKNKATKLASAFMEFLRVKNSIFSGENLTYTLSSEIIEKTDGYIFEVTSDRSETLPKFICVKNDWSVFTPTLIPALAHKIVDTKTVSELEVYADKPLNLGEKPPTDVEHI